MPHENVVNNNTDNGWEPKIIAFLCNWCSYAGADLAGTGRIQYPPNIRIIRVPCSGRLNPLFIIKALAEGADGVLVSGCHPGDCHYLTGNMYARRRFTVLKKLFETAGIEPDRVNFAWVSASEGGKFAEIVKEVTYRVKKIGPNNLANEYLSNKEDLINKFKNESTSSANLINNLNNLNSKDNTLPRSDGNGI